ncbi:MAG: hypothetical protein QXL86_01655 [Candidatus Aenigmatarchaeota archaeon]
MKLELGMLKEKLKGKDKFETAENYSILGIVVGVVILSLGFLLSIINPKGLAAILLMFGSFLSFISTVILVSTWLVKEFLS